MPELVADTFAPASTQGVERRLQQVGARALQGHVTTRHGDRHRIGAGLDAVRKHAVPRALQAGHALDDDARGAGAGDARTHLVEAIGDVADFRLARRVLDDAGAVGKRGRHQGRVRTADGDFGKHDFAAAQPVLGFGNDVAAVNFDRGSELLKRHDEEIDRSRADGAAARHRYARLAHASDERRDHPETRPHLGDELVGRRGVDDMRGGDLQRLALIGAVARALAVGHDVNAVIAEDALEQGHVGEPRNVVEDQLLLGEEARDHQRQRCVLRPGDRDCAMQRLAADNADTIHKPHPIRFRPAGSWPRGAPKLTPPR